MAEGDRCSVVKQDWDLLAYAKSLKFLRVNTRLIVLVSAVFRHGFNSAPFPKILHHRVSTQIPGIGLGC